MREPVDAQINAQKTEKGNSAIPETRTPQPAMLKGNENMDMLEIIKGCRSVRKYTSEQIAREDLERIVEAGIYSPNAGGAQRSMVVALHDADLAEKVGKLNMARFDRGSLIGNRVSSEQPSVIDDPSIKNGFYGAPTAICVFCQKDFTFSVPDAFVIAQAMALEAHSLGISSCIVSRGEQTFVSEEGKSLLAAWGVPDNYVCRAFLALGYCKGPYPQAKPRREGRVKIVEA